MLLEDMMDDGRRLSLVEVEGFFRSKMELEVRGLGFRAEGSEWAQ